MLPINIFAQSRRRSLCKSPIEKTQFLTSPKHSDALANLCKIRDAGSIWIEDTVGVGF